MVDQHGGHLPRWPRDTYHWIPPRGVPAAALHAQLPAYLRTHPLIYLLTHLRVWLFAFTDWRPTYLLPTYSSRSARCCCTSPASRWLAHTASAASRSSRASPSASACSSTARAARRSRARCRSASRRCPPRSTTSTGPDGTVRHTAPRELSRAAPYTHPCFVFRLPLLFQHMTRPRRPRRRTPGRAPRTARVLAHLSRVSDV